ncbi:MAG: hypothetical protein WCA00_21445 [Candidatus Acidiferrales bacterium]
MRKTDWIFNNPSKAGIIVFCVFCALSLVSCVLAKFAQAGGRNDEGTVLELKIWTEGGRHTYAERETIPLHAEITNVSSHDVLVGRNLWTNVSPSRVEVSVIPTDGHAMIGESGAVDGPPPNDDLTKAMLNWVLLLSSGYSFGSVTTLRSDLAPGSYKVRAVFTSDGIDSGSFYNPLLHHPDEAEKFRPQSWKGDIASNELTIRIVARNHKVPGQLPQ